MNGVALYQPFTCFIEPMNHSGYTESGIYVFDHDGAKDVEGNPISLTVRVLETHPTCLDARAGAVCVIRDPYNYEVVRRGDERYYIVHEQNLISEIEGYDEAAA